MTVQIVEPTRDRARHVFHNLRAADQSEIFGLMWDDDPDMLTDMFMARPLGLTDVFERDGEPVAVLGAVPYWPGVWEVFAFGTDKWQHAIHALSKRASRFLVPALYHQGVHRMQAWSEATHHDAHKWLEGLMHARREATAKGFGKHGQDYHLFMWDRPAMERMMEARHVLRRK